MTHTSLRRHFAKIASVAALGASAATVGIGPRLLARGAGRWPRRARPARQFPQGFLWGTATASYQVEGAVSGGRPRAVGLGHLRPHARQGRRTTPPATSPRPLPPLQGRRAVDEGARRQGLPVLDRVAARVPAGQPAQPNPKGLDFYNRLVDELLANGIQPFATLYHWDLPQALQDRVGGWESRDTSKAFADYAGLRRRAAHRSREAHLHDQRVRRLRGARLRHRHPRARAEAAARAGSTRRATTRCSATASRCRRSARRPSRARRSALAENMTVVRAGHRDRRAHRGGARARRASSTRST